MTTEFFLRLSEMAIAILRNHASGNTDEVLKGLEELTALANAGRQAVIDQQGKPIDPDLVKP